MDTPLTEPLRHFRVTWTIDVFANSPESAVKEAVESLPCTHDFSSLATVFNVQELDQDSKVINQTQIDISEEAEFT